MNHSMEKLNLEIRKMDDYSYLPNDTKEDETEGEDAALGATYRTIIVRYIPSGRGSCLRYLVKADELHPNRKKFPGIPCCIFYSANAA